MPPKRSQRPSAPALPLLVRVRNIAGQSLELQADGNQRVKALKQQVEERWGSPLLCQKLMLGAEVLENEEPLKQAAARFHSSNGEGEAPDLQSQALELMLVVSVDAAQRQMREGVSVKERLDALAAFDRLARKGCRGSIAAVCELLADKALQVRMAALYTLPSFAAGQDDRAAAAVIESLEDKEAEVRRWALRVLPQLARPGCEVAARAANSCLADHNSSVSSEAVVTVVALAQQGGGPGGSFAAATTCQHLRNKRPEVRAVALLALGQIPEAADADMLARLGSVLDDRDEVVRQEAQAAMCRLVPNERERKVVTSCCRLSHGRAEMRLTAIRALARDAPLGDKKAVAALCGCLLDKGKGLRLEVLGALPQVASRGDEKVMEAILACLHDSRDEVRVAALRILPAFVSGKQQKASAAVTSLLGDKHIGHEAQRTLQMLEQAANAELAADKGEAGAGSSGPGSIHQVTSSAGAPAVASRHHTGLDTSEFGIACYSMGGCAAAERRLLGCSSSAPVLMAQTPCSKAAAMKMQRGIFGGTASRPADCVGLGAARGVGPSKKNPFLAAAGMLLESDVPARRRC